MQFSTNAEGNAEGNPQPGQVTVWSYNSLDSLHALQFHVLDPDGQPYFGDEVSLTSPEGDIEIELCVLRRGEAGALGIHHCPYHTLVLVRWGPGGYDGYDLEEVLT